jgi:glycosyltransferase involved in cell wall biosynthesis
MNIAHVVPSFYPATAYGGPLESVYALCRASASQGSQIRVLTTDADGPKIIETVEKEKEMFLSDHVTIRYCHRQWPESISFSLLQSLRAYVAWADVVHLTAVYSFPTLPTLAFCKAMNKPVVWSPRGALERWKGTRKQAGKALWEFVCRTLAPQQWVLHVTSEEEGQKSLMRFPGLRTAVIPNGVDVQEPKTQTNHPDALRLLFLGRLDPKKGIENLLEACHQLPSSLGRSWSLKIAGAGTPEYEQKIRTLIASHALQERVTLVGFVQGEKKRDLLREADVLVAPSHTENFCMVVAEALAAGTPVIASQGTPWKRVEAMDCGLWVSNEPECLRQAISDIRLKPLTLMGERGRQWMKKEFTWESVGRQMNQLYASLKGESL